MNPLRVGLAGLGTVGGSVAKLLIENRDAIAARAGRPIELVRAASRTPKPDIPLDGAEFDTELRSLASNDVDVLVELIGGDGTAKTLVQNAIAAGQHVVTANKALLAACGDTLFASAQERGLSFGFEGSVAGGIPIIDAVRSGLAANRIDALAGIVNGTSNYILTAMEEEGRSFEDALAEAQRLGYAEADPTFDVEGIDAAQSSPSSPRSRSTPPSTPPACMSRASPASTSRTSATPANSASRSSTWAWRVCTAMASKRAFTPRWCRNRC